MRTRQVDVHPGPLARRTVQGQQSLRLGGKGIGLRQAEPGALPWRLGSEERIEGARHHLGRHAHAVVAHAQLQVVARRQAFGRRVGRGQCEIPGADPQPAAAAHRIARIDRQVQQCQVELQGLDPDRPQAAVECGLDDDAVGHGATDQLQRAVELRSRIHRHQAPFLHPSEGAELAGERGGARDGALAGVDQALQLRFRRLHRGQLQRRGERLQQVVEFVRDAGRQAPQRLELLAAQQGALRLFGGEDGFVDAVLEVARRAADLLARLDHAPGHGVDFFQSVRAVGNFLAVGQAVGAAAQVFDRRHRAAGEPAPGGHRQHQQHRHHPGQQRGRFHRHAADLGARDGDQDLPAGIRHRRDLGPHRNPGQGMAGEDQVAVGGGRQLARAFAQQGADVMLWLAGAGGDAAVAVEHGSNPGLRELLALEQPLQDAHMHAERQVVARLALDQHRHLHHEVVALHRRCIEHVRHQGARRAVAFHQRRQVGRVAPRQRHAQRAARIQDRLAVEVVQHRHRIHGLGRTPGVAVELAEVARRQRRRRGQGAQDAFLVAHLVIDQQGKCAAGLGDAALLVLLLFDIDIGDRQRRADERRHEQSDNKDQ